MLLRLLASNLLLTRDAQVPIAPSLFTEFRFRHTPKALRLRCLRRLHMANASMWPKHPCPKRRSSGYHDRATPHPDGVVPTHCCVSRQDLAACPKQTFRMMKQPEPRERTLQAQTSWLMFNASTRKRSRRRREFVDFPDFVSEGQLSPRITKTGRKYCACQFEHGCCWHFRARVNTMSERFRFRG